MAVFRVVKNNNYTVMSNYHLKDKQLSLKAKGLLSLMLSLPEDWDYTLKGLARISKEGVDSINTAVRELCEHGYIKRERIRDEQGRLKGTDYEIYEHPQKESGSEQQEPDREYPALEKPKLENPILDIPRQEEPVQENPAQLNTNILNTKKQNTNLSIYPSIEDEIDQIREHISYDVLKNPFTQSYLDEIVELIAEVKRSQKTYWQISGYSIADEDVKRRFEMLDGSHIRYVLECFKENRSPIYNIKKYLLAALYNAPATIDHYYTQLAKCDESAGNGV